MAQGADAQEAQAEEGQSGATVRDISGGGVEAGDMGEALDVAGKRDLCESADIPQVDDGVAKFAEYVFGSVHLVGVSVLGLLSSPACQVGSGCGDGTASTGGQRKRAAVERIGAAIPIPQIDQVLDVVVFVLVAGWLRGGETTEVVVVIDVDVDGIGWEGADESCGTDQGS